MKASRKRRKKPSIIWALIWITISIVAIAVVLFALITYKPADFVEPEPIGDNEVSKYLTHVLGQELYNNSQREEPFDLIVTEEGINDIVVRLDWPQQLGEFIVHTPRVIFEKDEIIIQSIVDSGRLKLLATLEGSAFIDEKGLLNLVIKRIKFGALNVTLIAKSLAKSYYEQQRLMGYTDPISDKIAASILNNEPVEPVFRIQNKIIKINGVHIDNGTVTLHIIPVQDTRHDLIESYDA